ncbi:hypothetical protein GSI_13992 [Ganoderma sinense ZZ0214-1]|uniref:LIM zinc-binding domain-containing protein n=1 Tax=Ganoderma sinense ZZ0214-1 TaxID=1077348 RepID=A0A2G8RRV0_9APHY|nr:hypothetical protein GSI_13992 [Ganoderma sinense ZZ0214-1]
MAQLVAPPPGSERISQFLPTVKCSTCNAPVPISELGDHVCAPVPPVPKLPALRPPQSPRSVAALLPSKLQGLVATAPPPQSPPRTSTLAQVPLRQKSPAPRQKSPAPPPNATGRARAPSSASSFSVRSSESRPDRVLSPPGRPSGRTSVDKVSFPSNPGPSTARAPPPVSPLPADPFAASPVSIERSTTPGGRANNIPLPGAATFRSRAPSNASMRQPALSNPPRMPIMDPRGSGFGPMSPPGVRQRAGTNVSLRPPPSPDYGPEIIYSTDMRSRTPANDPSRMRAPSAPSMPPSMDQVVGRPSMDQVRRPSAEAQRPPFMGGPGAGGRPPPDRTPPPPMSPGTPRPTEPDTKSGGEAGMAGVGRRGFAAAVRAAMFTTGPAPMMGSPGADPMLPNQGMDGRRANAPRFLDIGSATRYAPNTPPLSPGSGSASLSPHSPYSQKSPALSDPASPGRSPNITPTNQTAGIASSPTSPISASDLRDRVRSPPHEPPKVPSAGAEPPSTPRLPFFEKFKNKLPSLDTDATRSPIEPSPASPSNSDDSYNGLAYANSDDDEQPLDMPLRASPQPIVTPTKAKDTQAPTPAKESKVRFPSMTESRYSSSSATAQSPRAPQRSLSSSTAASSSYTPRTPSKSTGALDRVMETLMEDGPTSPTASTVSSLRMPADSPTNRDRTKDRESATKSPKLPMRSHTSPTLPSNRLTALERADGGKPRSASTKRPRTRTCVRCVKPIEDGRWIQVEGGSVLCDRCWKNMYLPKCRRCNKTIEKQAVSSSDGQLKGKWHRDCFSCFTCQKPFPDRSFYVYDGKPFCAYHYHEENNSLCAAARCGQPIEGPCAVSHAGDRYHPEHFLCEYRGCTERLVEYYELDGRMLCEQHVQKAILNRDEDDDDDAFGDDVFGAAGNRNTMAMKRVTRFIDLDALGKTLS